MCIVKAKIGGKKWGKRKKGEKRREKGGKEGNRSKKEGKYPYFVSLFNPKKVPKKTRKNFKKFQGVGGKKISGWPLDISFLTTRYT